MAQEYIVKDVKVWEGSEHPTYGTKLSVSFSGVGEPVDMTAKKFPVVGETEYGEIKEYTTQKGTTRQKFTRVKKDDESGAQRGGYSGGGKKPAYNENGQKHGAALKIAADYIISKNIALDAEDFLKKLKELSDRIYALQIPGETQEQSGYEKAKAVAATLPKKEAEPAHTDEEYQEQLGHEVAAAIDSGEPINLDDIPF